MEKDNTGLTSGVADGAPTVMRVHNVNDRRSVPSWIGAWDVEPLYYNALSQTDIGRTVIYRDAHTRANPNQCRAEAGTITSFRDGKVWARYSHGDTAAAADAADLCFGVSPLDGDLDRADRIFLAVQKRHSHTDGAEPDTAKAVTK